MNQENKLQNYKYRKYSFVAFLQQNSAYFSDFSLIFVLDGYTSSLEMTTLFQSVKGKSLFSIPQLRYVHTVTRSSKHTFLRVKVTKWENAFPGNLLALDTVKFCFYFTDNPGSQLTLDTLVGNDSLADTVDKEVRGQGRLQNSHCEGGVGEDSVSFSRPPQLCECLPAQRSSSSKMFSVFPSNKNCVLTICPGWSPVLSRAFGPVVDKSWTHTSTAQDWQDPNKLRQQHIWY